MSNWLQVFPIIAVCVRSAIAAPQVPIEALESTSGYQPYPTQLNANGTSFSGRGLSGSERGLRWTPSSGIEILDTSWAGSTQFSIAWCIATETGAVFGDVVLTPVKVTREPLMFEQFQTKAPATTLTTDPVLKLWLRSENRSGSYAFPPFDSGLMSHRTPRFSADDSTIVNSMLNISSPATSSPVRVLNFLQTMDNAFVIVGQQSGKVIIPEETLETFIACSEDIQYITPTAETGYTWRVQFRKGVHESSGHGVTTLVDVLFSEADITEAAPPATPATTPAAG